MHKLLTALAAAALAMPAAGQAPAPDPLEDERDRSWVHAADDPAAAIARVIPPAGQVEAMAPALDRMLGALLHVDVGPILDAADPWRRGPDYGRPGRTLSDLARRDDPYFEERLRGSIYGATSDMARMMDGFAAAAPGIARAAREMERAIDAAADEYRRGRGPDGDWD